ncbi:MAG TPA: barstar family protein [Burkholderiales bacterium]|jgi:hypothetical protein|nr:barstar family protein [Burkholderiales bacterium]
MDYEQLLSNAGEAGIFASPAEVALVAEASQRLGLAVWRSSLQGIDSKAALLERLNGDLPLPEYGASNWDALDEALNDAVWEQSAGVVLLLTHCGDLAQAAPEDFETALDVFDAVAESCYDEDIPFWVFIEGVDPSQFDLPVLGEEDD